MASLISKPHHHLADQGSHTLACSLSDLLSVYSDEGHSIVVEMSIKDLL